MGKNIFKNSKVFINILLQYIQENCCVLLVLIFLFIVVTFIGCCFANIRYLNFAFKLLIENIIGIFITILIVKALDIQSRISGLNFELPKNLFVEKCVNLFACVYIQENGITDEKSKRELYAQPNNKITKNIKDTIRKFKTEFKKGNYIDTLFEHHETDIELLLDFIIPEFERLGVSQKFKTSVNQFRFELLRLKERHKIPPSRILVSTLKEDYLNHLFHSMEDLWRTLYKEEHNFYNISENNFKKKNIEILAILHNVFMQPILIGIILFLIFPSECKYLFGVSLLLAFVIYFTVILVYSFWENNKQDS